MQDIRNIRWIDVKPSATLAPFQQEGAAMSTHKIASQTFPQTKGARASASQLLLRAWRMLRRWNQLARQRHQLAGLSDEMLKDIGRSRADVEWEASRPFWDDPDRR